jgi:hypothetical protein
MPRQRERSLSDFISLGEILQLFFALLEKLRALSSELRKTAMETFEFGALFPPLQRHGSCAISYVKIKV